MSLLCPTSWVFHRLNIQAVTVSTGNDLNLFFPWSHVPSRTLGCSRQTWGLIGTHGVPISGSGLPLPHSVVHSVNDPCAVQGSRLGFLRKRLSPLTIRNKIDSLGGNSPPKPIRTKLWYEFHSLGHHFPRILRETSWNFGGGPVGGRAFRGSLVGCSWGVGIRHGDNGQRF